MTDSEAERLARMEGKLDVVLADHERRLSDGELVHDRLHGRVTDLGLIVTKHETEIINLTARSAGMATKVLALVGSIVAAIGFGFTVFTWIMEHKV